MQCRACHQVGETAKNGVGPVLNGLFGRQSGSIEGYNYSEANKNSGIAWDEAVFAEYIQNPRAKIPGTKMIYAGLKDEQRIKDLTAFLKQYDAYGKKTARSDACSMLSLGPARSSSADRSIVGAASRWRGMTSRWPGCERRIGADVVELRHRPDRHRVALRDVAHGIAGLGADRDAGIPQLDRLAARHDVADRHGRAFELHRQRR